MDASQLTILILIGLIGGVWNAIAGGATLFTFPALMAAGLPPLIANATNYLALLPANLAALPAYRNELKALGASLLPLMVVSGAGAVVGALLLLVLDANLFLVLIPFLILIATGLFAVGEELRKWLVSFAGDTATHRIVYAALFITSIYGGFFGAGLSIILLAIAQIIGFTDFHIANSIKNLLAASFTILSIFVFGFGGLIAWPEAATMMVGSASGGFLGGRFAKRIDQRILRWSISAFGILLAMVYFARAFI